MVLITSVAPRLTGNTRLKIPGMMRSEKDIIKLRSHEKLLTGNGRAPSSTETGLALQDGISHMSTSRVKRNKKQRLAYKK